ncbi:MAG: FAD binding domain-containing protein, partial [Deltaproteobacteria bacterium]|nr:FAD binding domain-containing protein [Deltaproteobacteria bacterium]
MELLRPATLQEALDALAVRGGRAKPLAGGTDLVVRMKEGVERGASFVSLARCVELHGIREEGDE